MFCWRFFQNLINFQLKFRKIYVLNQFRAMKSFYLDFSKISWYFSVIFMRAFLYLKKIYVLNEISDNEMLLGTF